MHKISFYSFSYQPHSNLTLTWCWSPFESSIMFMIISRTKYFCHFGSMATRYQCQYPVYESARVQYTCIPVCLYTVYLHTCQYFLVFKYRDAVETSCSSTGFSLNVQQHQGQNIEGFTSTLSSSSAFIFAFGLGGVGKEWDYCGTKASIRQYLYFALILSLDGGGHEAFYVCLYTTTHAYEYLHLYLY